MAHYQDESELRATERNALLRDLPTDDYEWIAQHLEEVQSKAGEVLAEADQRPRYIYFPQSGVVSLMTQFANGTMVETGTIGNEGIVGMSIVLDVDSSPNKTMTQIDAVLRRMPTEEFAAGIDEHPSVGRILRRYIDAYLVQVSQTAACNRMHDLAQRCAKWLLMTHDRVGVDTFALTHEFLAIMLGVRRAGVSEAAAELQRAGAIRYSRGKVTIVNRAVLEQRSCECYQVVRTRFNDMLEAGMAGRPREWEA